MFGLWFLIQCLGAFTLWGSKAFGNTLTPKYRVLESYTSGSAIGSGFGVKLVQVNGRILERLRGR